MNFNKITVSVLQEIKNIVGEAFVYHEHDDMEKYSRDETEDLLYYPEVVVRPQTPQHISELLILCNSHMIPVTPRGAAPG